MRSELCNLMWDDAFGKSGKARQRSMWAAYEYCAPLLSCPSVPMRHKQANPSAAPKIGARSYKKYGLADAKIEKIRRIAQSEAFYLSPAHKFYTTFCKTRTVRTKYLVEADFPSSAPTPARPRAAPDAPLLFFPFSSAPLCSAFSGARIFASQLHLNPQNLY